MNASLIGINCLRRSLQASGGCCGAVWRKTQKSRLRDIADVRFAIEDSAHAERTTTTPVVIKRFRRLWFALASIFLAIALAAAWWIGRRTAAPTPAGGDNPLVNAEFTRFTDLPGSEWDASISPDGKFVVFLSDSEGRADVWLSQVGTGRFNNLTQGREITGDLFVRNMGISHDGSEIWLAGRFPDRRLKRMPLIGGTSSNFLQEHAVNLAWSTDGARLAYHIGEPGDPMFVADRNGGSPRRIFVNQRPGGHNHFPFWSDDGQWIYFVTGILDTQQMDLWRIRPSGESPERLTHHDNDVTYPTPIDSRTILYLSPAEDGSGPWLWSLDTERKTTRRVSYGLEKYTSLSASADGRRLVATVSNPAASLWSVPILDGGLIVYTGAIVAAHAPLLAVLDDGTPIKMPSIPLRRGGERYRFLPKGKSLIHMQGDFTWQDFWLLDLATMKSRLLTKLTNKGAMRTFDVTADEGHIIFDRARDNSDIVLIDL